MLLKDGKDWHPSEKQFEKLKGKYPYLSIPDEIAAMEGYLRWHIPERPEETGIVVWVTKWLDKRNLAVMAELAKPLPVRLWTKIDHETHDFMDDANYRAFALQKYGQYMSHDGYRFNALGPVPREKEVNIKPPALPQPLGDSEDGVECFVDNWVEGSTV